MGRAHRSWLKADGSWSGELRGSEERRNRKEERWKIESGGEVERQTSNVRSREEERGKKCMESRKWKVALGSAVKDRGGGKGEAERKEESGKKKAERSDE